MKVPMRFLPIEIQNDWHANLQPAQPGEVGNWRLIHARPTNPAGYQSGKVIVQLLDENERAIPDVEVVFSYDTATPVIIDGAKENWVWTPPPQGRRGDIVITGGGGTAEHVQGSAVKDGQPGGITVWIKDPARPSDYVLGAGMLADHTGLLLTFQKQDAGVVSDAERLESLELNYEILEEAIERLNKRIDEIEGRTGQMVGLRPSVVTYEEMKG